MDYTLGYFNTRERLQWFVHHPLYYYRLLMTNPEYQQFYYSSKWDLQQSDMVRKVTRGSNRRPAILPAVGSGPPALTYGGGNEPGERPHHPYGNGIGGAGGITKGAVVTIIQESEDFCPQCGIQYNTTKNRKVTEACNHSKCWHCIFESEEGCAQCRQTESPVVVEEPKQIYNHRSVNTRRSAAAARQQSATLSRGNSVNSARPSSSSPGSTSNDTGRQSSSVYSDSADSDSCLRFPTSGGVMEVNDSYPSTIDYETISVLTSPSLDNTQYVSLAEYNADSKSYNAIVEEENDFSISLTSGFRGSLPLNHNHNSGGGTRTSPILGSNTQGGLVTRGHIKEASDLTQSSPGSHSISTSPSSSKRRSRESPTVESVIGNKIASGGGSPDITQGVSRDPLRSSRLSGRGEPEQRLNQLAPRNVKIQKNQEPVPTTSYLNDLLTKGHKGGSANTSTLIHSNRGNDKDSGPPVKHESGQSPSSHSSNDEQHNHDEESGDGKLEEDDEGKGDEEPVPKKKKKRSPVVIHDHITILGGDPPMYQCNLCNKKFKTKAHIKYHEFCQKGDKPFKCEICGQGFIAKSHYEYHLRTHTGERPYVCPKCGKGFNQRGKVTRHMRSHTGEKPFICQECNRGFANAQALRCHTLIHTGERPFACTYCNKRFTGMTNLKKHVITHTGERPFSCNHCGKSFGLKWTLDLHLRTHSSERPYACDQCTRAFSNSKDLRRHLVIHSGERPFQCRICQTAFRRKDNLDRHIKNTHNQPKEIAKQLANEAASEYLKNNSKSQSLGNIPVSKVNSIVIGTSFSPFAHWKKHHSRSSLLALANESGVGGVFGMGRSTPTGTVVDYSRASVITTASYASPAPLNLHKLSCY